MEAEYSVERARTLGWASVTGALNPERVGYLEKHLVGSTILDAGCGGGGYAHYLHGRGYLVTGVDAHDTLLSLARATGPGATFVQADIRCLPFSDKSFDSTYCFDVLEHIDDDRVAVTELARVTRRRLVLSVPREDDVMRRYGLTFFHYTDRTHLRQYTEGALRELVGSIPLSSVLIFPELPVDLAGLMKELVTLDSRLTLRARLLVMYLRACLRRPRLVGAALRHEWFEANTRSATASLWATASFRPIYTGIVAVIDLAG